MLSLLLGLLSILESSKRNEDSLMAIKVNYSKTFQKETQSSPKY